MAGFRNATRGPPETGKAGLSTGLLIGRSRVIRTLVPLLPKQVRYQAALYSEKGIPGPAPDGMAGVIATAFLWCKRGDQPRFLDNDQTPATVSAANTILRMSH